MFIPKKTYSLLIASGKQKQNKYMKKTFLKTLKLNLENKAIFFYYRLTCIDSGIASERIFTTCTHQGKEGKLIVKWKKPSFNIFGIECLILIAVKSKISDFETKK